MNRPNMIAYAFETLTVSTTALPFTVAVYAPSLATGQSLGDPPCVLATGTVETNPTRYRVDGLAPTASVGHLVSAGQTFTVEGVPAVRSFRIIRQGAADATVTITYWREGP